MKRIYLLFCIVFNLALNAQNPIASYYGNDSYPTWTDKIKWVNKINMGTYSNGVTNFERFENARDLLYLAGGGVLYYPTGTYDFTSGPYEGPNGRGLMLKTGVVILGDRPVSDSVSIDGTLVLPTKFIFKYIKKPALVDSGYVPCDWNIIGLKTSASEQLKDVNNIGIAWVHLEGATVYFGPQFTWGAKYSTAGAWMSTKTFGAWANRVPDGTHPIDPYAGGTSGQPFVGAGKGRFVFGCVIANAVVINNAIDYGLTSSVPKPNPDFYFMYKFAARIQIYGSNVFIGNNLLPKPTKCFKYNQLICNTDQSKGCSKVCLSNPIDVLLFDYAINFGVECNKSLYNVTSNKDSGYFQKNVIIKDNYIYNHGRKGVDASGLWTIIKNNKNIRNYCNAGDDIYGLGSGWTLTLDGYIKSCAGGNGCISDNLSRAYDICGKALWVDSNYYDGTGSNPGNDGEGILAQTDGGTSTLNSWCVTRNQGNGSYMGGYNINQYGSLFAWNTGANTYGNMSTSTFTDAAFVSNSIASTGTGDLLLSCPGISPTAPTNVLVSLLSDSTGAIITWADASSDEIGFRIDKRIGTSGNWKTVVYRPRHSTGSALNVQMWIDYMIPRGVNFYYRVVAIACSDDNTGASAILGPHRINDITTEITESAVGKIHFEVYPNPSSDIINIVLNDILNSHVSLIISDAGGRIIREIQIENVTNSIGISDIDNGLYFITLKTGDNKITTKFIKF